MYTHVHICKLDITFIYINTFSPEYHLAIVTHFVFNKVASPESTIQFNNRSIYFAVKTRYILCRIDFIILRISASTPCRV